MAIQSQPSRIPEPFAGSGTKNTIPATNATPSASQAASWASGFPPECSQPISAGGCPVPRNDVNGVLNQISQDFAFWQDGGIWEWSALADYDAARLVRGSDGSFYRSVAQSGPSSAGGAVDPTQDDGTHWVQMPSLADVEAQNYATQSWVDGKGFAFDTAVVHKTGDETVNGNKTFGDTITIKDSYPGIDFRHETATKGDQTTKYCDINFYDNEPDTWGIIRCAGDAVAGSISLRAYKWVYNSGSFVELVVAYNSDGVEVVRPSEDNNVILGSAGRRWQQVYAGTSSINTSDEREKASIASIPDEVLDAWGSVGFVQFQFRDAFAEKGEKARLHSGLVAQRIDEAFKAAGLDASRYGLFCHDSWEAEPEKLNADGTVDTPAFPAGDRYSLRYEEALCMEAAYQRRRADRAEARLAALEEKLAAIEAKLG